MTTIEVKEVEVNTEAEASAYLPDDVELPQLEFLTLMIEEVLGGQPVFGYNRDTGRWLAIPTCTCEQCKEFKDGYEPELMTTLLGAAHSYAKKRMKYIKDTCRKAPLKSELH